MPKIAVFGGTGYLASLIKNQNKVKKNKYIFFSRKKTAHHYINYLLFKKNLNILKNYDCVVHLVGPNQNQLLKNKNLIKKKNLITSNICDLCLNNNIKLIYISSMQIYENYGKNNLSINSKINLKNPYSKKVCSDTLNNVLAPRGVAVVVEGCCCGWRWRLVAGSNCSCRSQAGEAFRGSDADRGCCGRARWDGVFQRYHVFPPGGAGDRRDPRRAYLEIRSGHQQDDHLSLAQRDVQRHQV